MRSVPISSFRSAGPIAALRATLGILAGTACRWPVAVALCGATLVPGAGAMDLQQNHFVQVADRLPGKAKVRRYIHAYKGGECFFAHPMLLKPGFARIEVLASRKRLAAVQRFDRDFKAHMGFEAFIRLRLITAEQCRLATMLDARGKRAIDGRLSIRLAQDRIASGGELIGKILGGRGARLYIYDPRARLVDVTRYIIRHNGNIAFRLPRVHGAGPMILIAVRWTGKKVRAVQVGRPRLGQVLKSGQSEGAVALGFFKLK